MSPLRRICSRCRHTSEDDGHDHCAGCRARTEARRTVQRKDRSYYSAAWRRRREQVRLVCGNRCEGCGMTNAEHKAKTGNSLGVNHRNGNTDDWTDGNLRVECYWCHNATDSARRTQARHLLVAIVGLPGTGKSAVAHALAADLRATVYSIDDFRRREPADAWTRMVSAIMATNGPVVGESNIIPPGYRRLLSTRRSLIVRLTANAMVREQRLVARGDHPNRVARYVRVVEPRLQVGMTIETDLMSIAETTRAIRSRLR